MLALDLAVYTWGKLALRELRGRAEAAWGSGYSNSRFPASLLELGSPPLGLMSAVLVVPGS